MGEPWYREFFRGDWQSIAAAQITPETGEPQARFIAEALALQPGDRVLDTVCGNGRHAVPLAGMGYDVTGTDLSEVQIAAARAAAEAAGVSARFMQCDMRELPFEAEFDAAYNAFTSFGYFEDPEEDRKALRDFRRALRPGGRFFIDYVNFIGLVPVFRQRHWQRFGGQEQDLLLLEHQWDLLEGSMRDTWTIRRGVEESSYSSFVRMYTPYEMRRELEHAGFRVTRAFGGWDASELTRTSLRLILVADAV